MNKLRRAGLYAWIFIRKVLVPVAICVIAFVAGLTAVDRYNVEKAAPEEFVNYTSFNVPNAREGEDVYFTLCRDHKENYTFEGNLDIYVIQQESGKPVKVYARNVGGQISNDCDNKVIKAKDFHHTPNLYEMSFCIDIHVKYDIKKTICKTSNHYRIYAQPSDLASKVASLELELAEAKSRYSDSVANNDTSGTPSTLSTGSVRSNDAANPQEPSTPPPVAQAPPPETCAVDRVILGLITVKIACASR